MRNTILLVNLSMLFNIGLIGCSNNAASSENDPQKALAGAERKAFSDDTTIVRVYVDKNSQITANGKSVSLAGLDTLLNTRPLENCRCLLFTL